MTDQERDQLARDIYEAATILSGYSDGYYKPWPILRDCDRARWQRSADKVRARLSLWGYERETTRRAA